jgi:hypothetical protein
MNSKQVPGAGRMTFTDGHELNESYKKPSAHPAGRENSSYMHPHVEKLSLEKPWSSVDKSLAEAGRPSEQLSRSKTVFPVSSGKVRGTPTPPAYAKATRGPSHSPSPGAIPGVAKPVVS